MRDVLKWTVIGGVFLLPFVPLVVTGSMFFSYITGKNFAFRMIVEVIFAAWALLALYDAKYRPRFSWILVSLAAFVGIIFFADLLGASPVKSFWSNFERMEGWVTLIHLLMYFLVAGSVLTTEKTWSRFFNTSLAAAGIVSLYALLQLVGWVGIAQGGVRIDATLGNAIYMAAYMLFHVFVALLLLAKSKATGMRVFYGVVALIFAFLLFATGTRGTILGLVVGLLVTALCTALSSGGSPVLRKIGLGGIAVVLIASGTFYVVRTAPFVQESPILGRIASIFSLKQALSTRTTIWDMALEGVKERPILGWGQSNFDYVFDVHYKPTLYAQEQWFDRVHNIVLDWLVAGGILGFLAYLAVWAAVVYALSTRPRDDTFSVAERALLVGVLVGYGIHNIAVFDNLISYFFFVTILAFVHTRVANGIPRIFSIHLDEKIVSQIAVPVVGVALCLSLYFVNVPNIRAARDIINALKYLDTAARREGITAITPEAYNTLLMGGLDEFKAALGRHSFSDQEIREQLALSAQKVYVDKRAAEETKRAWRELTESELEQQIAKDPHQARMRAFLGTFYRTVGETDKALDQFAAVLALSPNKQSILFDVGSTYIERKEYAKAKEVFKEAFMLAPEYGDARTYYIVSALYTDDHALARELSAPPYDALYRESDLILQTYYALKKYDAVLPLLDARIEKNPNDVELRVSYAAVQHESGNTKAAIETLRQAIKDFPEFKTQAEQFIKEINK